MRKNWRDTLKGWNGEVDNTFDHMKLSALMAIHAELVTLNSIMRCSNVAKGFTALAKIARRDERAFKRRVEHAVAKRIKRATT